MTSRLMLAGCLAVAVPALAATDAGAAASAGKVTLGAKDANGVALAGDPVKGGVIFKQCATCHSIAPGNNLVGPSLSKIVGRKAGSVSGFGYSKANLKSGITWTEQELYGYLENPRKRVPGTLMSFAGLKDSQQRADVIAYLKLNAK